ncbi:hypothetical protein PQQ84_05485 [Paraburkholderia strydomiana]|uniref:hypothetical protein n=1 Tax=Paraburkholderia strydomiana TaxID=1245417 RepID=UPI0038B7E3AA
MYRIDDATAATSLPAPEAAGTEGYFTEGNPATGTPATKVRGSWLNMLQEELRAIVVAAGLTPSKTAYNQVLTAIQSGLTGHGQCRLSVTSTTALKLAPFNGNKLIINGVSQTIPSAGVTLSNSGLSATTVYYVYAYMNAGTMALEAVTTAHATGTNGVEIKSGDATRTLVGLIRTGASSQFLDTAAARFCLNWFNKRKIVGSVAATPGYTFTNTSLAEINTALRVEFICWADDIPIITANGAMTQSATASIINATCIDSVSSPYTPGQQETLSASFTGPFAVTGGIGGLSEGYHFSMFCANVNSGTATINSIQTIVNLLG